MATSSIVNNLGAGSGIDVKSLAQSLVDAEKTPRKERIDAQIAKSEAKITGYSAVKYALSTLKTAFGKLNDASDFSSIQPANTQPGSFNITASTTAEAGSYSIEVLQTALEQRTASSVFPERSTALNSGNPFTLNLSIAGGTAQPIVVAPQANGVARAATPADVVSAINGAKLGVSAQLINTGNGHQIVLSGQTGFANRFTLSGTTSSTATIQTDTPDPLVVNAEASTTSVTASFLMSDNTTQSLALVKDSDGNWVLPVGSTRPDGTVSLSANKPVQSPLFNQSLETATDARFNVNGLEITRSSNNISDVIEGVTLDLYSKTSGPARLDLNRNTTGIKDNVRGLVTAYNEFEETLKILGDSKSEVEEFGGVLAGESLLQSVRSQVRGFIINNSSTPGTSIKAARDVGLSIDRFGKLTLDETKLDNALQNKFGEVSTMFSAGTNNQSIYSTAPAGLAGGAINRIEKMLLSTGLIDTQSQNATKQITKYKEELSALESRMEKLMLRYTNQFSMMESIVGSSKSTREGLKGTFEGMMKAYTG
jgi:flagellar hook-associated protein 2